MKYTVLDIIYNDFFYFICQKDKKQSNFMYKLTIIGEISMFQLSMNNFLCLKISSFE